MIRKVELQDTRPLTDIYNYYIAHSTATFDITPIGEKEMRKRIVNISTRYPYFVYENEGKITGYCYAHPWKEKDAYSQTLETTVYVAPGQERKGIGTQLMQKLIETCRQSGFHSLIACITEDNQISCLLHERLGFVQVSHFKEAGFKFGKWIGIIDYQLIL